MKGLTLQGVTRKSCILSLTNIIKLINELSQNIHERSVLQVVVVGINLKTFFFSFFITGYFQKAKKLNVFKNDDETWDYTGALNNNSGNFVQII